MSDSAHPYIQCRSLTKTYRKGKITITPLEDLDLEVGKGEFLALMGPSGSGKTTLLNLIAGIDQPTSGELIIGGQNIADLSRGQLTDWRARHCGYVFQLYHLVPILSAFENVELPLLLDSSLSRKERREKVHAALDLVDLSDRADHRPTELSGGQEQRVGIARAIVNHPQVVVADEPTGALDPETSQQILHLLGRLNRELGVTLLMVTHDHAAAKVAHRQFQLDRGKLIETTDAEVAHV